MIHEISEWQLRNETGKIMRALDAGESFIITRDGVQVAELTPVARSHFAPASIAVVAFAGPGRVDFRRLRADPDRVVSQDSTPRT